MCKKYRAHNLSVKALLPNVLEILRHLCSHKTYSPLTSLEHFFAKSRSKFLIFYSIFSNLPLMLVFYYNEETNFLL